MQVSSVCEQSCSWSRMLTDESLLCRVSPGKRDWKGGITCMRDPAPHVKALENESCGCCCHQRHASNGGA